MKTIKKYTVGLLAVAATLMCGCTNELDEVAMPDGDIRITAVHIASDGLMTRAADAQGYEGIIKTTWADGDKITLTVGSFNGSAIYSNSTWKMYDSSNQEVSQILIPKDGYDAGLAVEAKHIGQGATEAEKDVLLAKGTCKPAGAKMTIGEANIQTESGVMTLSLAHTKSYIYVETANNITEDDVQSVQVVLRDANGTTIATPVTMKAILDENGNKTNTFECFAEAAYIEKFVVTMLQGDNTTYDVPVVPTYGTDNKGFALAANNRYPFKITISSSVQTKALGGGGNSARAYGVISFQENK